MLQVQFINWQQGNCSGLSLQNPFKYHSGTKQGWSAKPCQGAHSKTATPRRELLEYYPSIIAIGVTPRPVG